jgi:mannitol/fructose-specific phosphotransferase system IIA component (Ntr-type)
MKLASLFSAEHVILNLEARQLRDAVGEMLHRAENFRPTISVDELVMRVLEREEQAPTALEQGVAMPHARVPELRDFFVFAGIPSAPLENLCLDRTPVDMIFLIIAPNSKNTMMLQTMAALSVFCTEPGRLDALKKATSPEQFIEIVNESDVAVKKGLHARDLMQPCPVRATPDMPLRTLLDAMFANGVQEAPVISDSGETVGMVSSREVIEAGFPTYMMELPNVDFLTEFEPFEHFFKREATFKVAELMNKAPAVVSADDPMIQVVFELKKQHQRFAYVQERGQLVGVIDRDHILSRILRV